jgi:hypothetical protein
VDKVYEYIDGSGNKYVLTQDEKYIIEYIPIKPEFSSSGVYDGGEYLKKEIKEAEHDSIALILSKAIQNKKEHIDNRLKGSGMIIFKTEKEKNSYILKPKSGILNDIEKVLNNIII